ncbi:MAG: beta-ketoacyl-ACP synthase III [Bacteroidota bacterium]
MKTTAAITAIGHYLPDYRLTNQELERMVDTNDEWIRERTGIIERRLMKDGATSDMAVHAINELLEKRGIGPEEIDLVIVATVTPDHIFPATANIVSHAVGANNAWGFDVEAACSGFLYSVNIASKFIETGTHEKVIVVGADKMSSIIDYTDRNTCVLFGDAAAAILLEPNTEGYGILDARLYSDGAGVKHLHQVAGGSRKPPSLETVQNREHYVYQEGRAVFKFAVTKMADVVTEVMQRNSLSGDDIAYLVPHQANKRIIMACADRMNVSAEKVMLNIHKYGNTTGATIPLCLYEWQDKLTKGDNLILAAVGGGFTWGATYLKWAM